MKRTTFFAAAVALLLVSGGAAAAEEMAGLRAPTPLMFDPEAKYLRIPPPETVQMQKDGLMAVQATVTVNFLPPGPGQFGDVCITWPVAAQTAFNAAAQIWASLLQSPVPITVDACYANNMGAGVLGAAGPRNFFRNFPNAPRTNTWYPVALANALSGVDRQPAVADIYAGFSSVFTWYFGTTGTPPGGTLDFMSVVMHEIGHGLGFTGSMEVIGSVGMWGSGTPDPFIYDRFTEDNAGTLLVNYINGDPTLGTVLRSNAVFFDATNATAANGGARVPLYAPATWNDGSSYSHLAESFNGTQNALMTFSLGSGESIHNPGPVTLGMFRDMGWVMQAPASADLALTQTINANPAGTGKDAVFTMNLVNNGPNTATGVVVSAAYDATATVIWASPGCSVAAPGIYSCAVGSLANAATTSFKLVLRKSIAGNVFNNAGVTSATADPNSANNSPTLNVPVAASAAAVAINRYRLYSPVTLEHHFTTDLNEYNVLGTFIGTWVQEGTVGKVLNNPGTFGGVTAVPYYRLYNTATAWHHWTTDSNEYYTLALFPGWNQEGVDGWILPTPATGATQLYRLLYPFVAGLHHWTIDANEYNTLITTFGWVGEGGSGYVVQ